jgi:CubicO group peptidase (beta-lactamase class C family)
MKNLFLLLLLISSLTCLAQDKPAGRPVSAEQKRQQLDQYMTALYQRGLFTGAMLVADHGQIIYQKTFGLANRENHLPYTLSTPGYIGSVTKPFTAMGIMLLKERGLVRYDQSIRDFFPDLPACMQPVTLRHLLHHTSGLDSFNDFPDMTEKDVYAVLLKQSALRFPQGQQFEYCNSGYTLLGMVIEKVTGQSLNAFLTANIFQPLKMEHTSVNEIAHRSTTRAVGYDLFGTRNNYDSFIGGAGSMISTVGDLYKWDQALYNPKFIKPTTLAEAFTPSALTLSGDPFGEKSYGFGWWITQHNRGTHVSHNGAFGGFRADIERSTGERSTIIHISNLRHWLVFDIRDGITNILDGKPYVLPRIPISAWLFQQLQQKGPAAAIQAYRNLKNSDAGSQYNFSESELNTLGYYLKGQSRLPEATLIFALNAEIYPQSANAYDSLGEAYLASGNKQDALTHYKKSLALNPANEAAANAIKDLQEFFAKKSTATP